MDSNRFTRYLSWIFRLIAFTPLKPEEKLYYKTWFHFYRGVTYINSSIIIVLAIIEVKLNIRDGVRFQVYSKTLVVLAIYISLSSKTFYFYIFDKRHEKLVERIKDLFRTTTDTNLVERQVEDYARNADFLSAFWVISTMIGTQIFMLIPVVLTGQSSLPLKIWYPFPEDDQLLYVGTYAFQVFTHNLAVFNFIVTDMFFITSIVVTCSQFTIIDWEYQYMCYSALLRCSVSKTDVLDFWKKCEHQSSPKNICNIPQIMRTKHYNTELKRKFTDIIEFHTNLTRFCKDLEYFISPVMLTTILASIFHTTIIAFTFVTSTTPAELVSSVSYMVLTLIHIFTLNFVGQQIIDHSSRLERTLYDCPWYMCDSKFVGLLKFVHLRSQASTFLTIGKFAPINLQTFMWIIKSCVSYLTVLRCMDQDKTGIQY